VSDTIVLNEYQEQAVAITDEDAHYIADCLGGRLVVRRVLRGEGYALNPRQFVGVVRLPSGRQLECRPKVSVHNLFWMLAAACELPDPFLDEAADLKRIEDVLEVVASRLAEMIEQLVDQGLYRAYVETEENLRFVRGRIVVAEDIRHNFALRHRTFCRFSDYSWDIPENRIIRQTVRLLAGWSFSAKLTQRLRSLDAVLAEITLSQYAPADLDRIAYNRLNETYRPIHRLCRLFLEGASPSDESGGVTFNGFLLDMNRLFEAFITQALRDRLYSPFRVEAQHVVHLDRKRRVPMRPDILVRWNKSVAHAIDCKYKRLEPDDHRNIDLY
jgi:5-methylcytosine-specific restriction enzyme subunit McrC